MLEKLKTCCFCLLLFGSTCVSAQDEDDHGFLAPYLVNWSNTSTQFAHCETGNNSAHGDLYGNSGISDNHFLLGECPSHRSINLFYASTALIHYTAANVLPERYSRLLKDSTVSFQVSIFKDYSSMEMSMSF